MTRAMHLQQVKNKWHPKQEQIRLDVLRKRDLADFRRKHGIEDRYDQTATRDMPIGTVIKIKRAERELDYRAMQNREQSNLEWAETVSTPESRLAKSPWFYVIFLLLAALVACAFAAYWWA